MRIFNKDEIEDLALLVHKSKIKENFLTTEEMDAVNQYLRKSSIYYIQSHMILLSEKNPLSAQINLSFTESYAEKLEELFEILQAPYRIFLGLFKLFIKNKF